MELFDEPLQAIRQPSLGVIVVPTGRSRFPALQQLERVSLVPPMVDHHPLVARSTLGDLLHASHVLDDSFDERHGSSA
ncbi:hypothetical protein OEB96_11495 [Paraliomyxa miuraensis]|nr:hypothetical protein [Paraliomyxa miuraensis]